MQPQFARLNKAMARSLGLSADELLQAFAPANVDDIDEICELRRRGFGAHLRNDAEKMRWRYFSRNANRSDILVLKLDQKIVAAVGIEPVSVRLNGILHTGVRCADIVVEPALMGKGLGAWMNLYVQDQYPIVMAMGSNQNSASMVNKLFTAMPIRQYLKFPIRSGNYLTRKTGKFSAMQLARFPLDIWLWLRRKLYFARSAMPAYRVRRLENFEAIKQFAARAERDADHAANMLIAARDPEFIQWRYADNVVSRFVPFALFKNDDMVGFAVLRAGNAHHAGEWHLMDWQIERTHRNQGTVQYLMLGCVDYAATHGAPLVTALLSDPVSKTAATQAGFIFRYRDEGFHLWADDSISKNIYSTSQWFLSFADTDEVT